MVLIRATRRLLKGAAISTDDDLPPDVGPLGEWYANPVSLPAPGRWLVLFTSADTLVSVVAPGRSLRTTLPVFERRLPLLLRRLGLPEPWVQARADAFGEVHVAARTMRRSPERLGPVVATEHTKWMGLAREVSRAEGYEAARSAANIGEQYVYTRAAVGGTGHGELRSAVASKGKEVQSLQQDLAQLTSRHGQPAQILERIGQRAQALTAAQTNRLGRTLSPPQMAVVSKATGLVAKAARAVER